MTFLIYFAAAIILVGIAISFLPIKSILAAAKDSRLPLRVWQWLAPRITNKSMWMAVVANVPLYWPMITADPAMAAFLARHPMLYMAGAVVALMASRQHGTLRQLPPAPSPTGGLVNNEALA